MGGNRLREAQLQDVTSGRLFLCEMLGRCGPLGEYEKELAEAQINRVLCLAPLEEVRQKSPNYAAKLERGQLGVPGDHFPIKDYDVPEDSSGLVRVARDCAARLQRGERIVIHCGAGVGRTGTVAICLLMALVLPPGDARARVEAAHSWPETKPQQTLVERLGEELGG